MATDFHLLGAVEVWQDGRPVDVGHARRQCVLAVLLHDANQTVSQDQLVDRVWGNGRLPSRPLNAVQTYVSLLRRALGPIPQVHIALRSAGYLISVDTDTVDMHRFRALIDKARVTADNLAASLYEQALALWRGEPFATLDTPWLAAVRARLLDDRHAAELDLSDVQLRMGQHASLLSALADRVNDHPLDERAVGQLMLALYRSGRPADALEQYRLVHKRFANELGTDPSAPLRELHNRMLATDPTLATPANGPITVVPRQLPAPPGSFTGRARELAHLDDAMATTGTMMIAAICGIGGIGKTWVALHWAHDNVDRFPDGQLYVDLRGFDPGEVTSPSVAVRGFLDALGVHPGAIPADLDAQAALYRSVVSGRRMLIVLDNARDATQVVPLLPGSASCVVLVTSRRVLADLVARHGARPLGLHLLADVEAGELFARHLGRDRALDEAGPVAELLACCAGLPLAISNVATRAALRPDFSLAMFAEELRDVSSRLDALDGELTTNVRTVLSWSYDALDEPSAAVFRLLGLVSDVDVCAVAALADVPPGQARIVLRELESAHLVHQHVPGRYRMHDLVRLYAAERAEHDHAPTDRVGALHRLVDRYVSAAFVADQVLDPHRLAPGFTQPTTTPGPTRPPDQAAAIAWFTAEHGNLLAAQRIAAEHGWPDLTCALAWTLETWHRRGGHINEAVAAWRLGMAAAEQLGDQAVVALANRLLGMAYARAGEYPEALVHLRQAIVLSEAADDRVGLAHAHHLLACAWELQGDDTRALAHARRALPLFAALDVPVWQAWALDQVGWHEAQLGDHEQARAHCEAALALVRAHHDREGEAVTLDSLGYIANRTGRHTEAVAHYGRALALFRELGDSYEEAVTLDRLAEALHALGDVTKADAAWRQALALCRSQHRTADTQRIQRRLDDAR